MATRFASIRALSLVFFLSGSAYGSDWPQFRGPQASGIGAGNPVTNWDGESGKNVLWKRAIPSLGLSSPIVHGGRIYLTSAVSSDGKADLKVGLYGNIQPVEGEGAQKFVVYAIDRKSGKIVWERVAHEGVAKVKRHPKSSHANPTPATDGKHIVAFFGSEGLYCYDTGGRLIWKKDLGVLDSGFFQVPAAQWGFASSPVIHDGRVIIQADVQKNSFVAAFDLASGKELWRTARSEVPTFGTPAVLPYGAKGERRQVVLNGWKHIGGYDFETGKALWRLTGGGDIPVPTPIAAGGIVLITSAHGSERPIYAIKPTAAGDITGKTEHFAWKQDRAGNYMQTPLAADGLAYFCYDNGVLTVYDVATGERVYQQRLGSGTTGFSGSPVAAAGRLYITSEQGTTHVIKLGREFQELARNEMGEVVMATPAIADGVLYIRGRDNLYAIGK
jgi:outer membrane protein assembly factor BamB